MNNNSIRNILCVGAHPDDIELMAGGTLAKWISEGYSVHVLTISDGIWTNPSGIVMREREIALQEEIDAANFLGYSVENLNLPAMDIQFQDSLVVEILKRVEGHHIDTMIIPWERDLHHDHEVVSRIALSASRRVPRLIMGQINYYLSDVFTPNLFVDISDFWDRKIEALKCYSTQWDRAGSDWIDFLDETTRYYGKMAGVKRAEGFITKKFLLDNC